MAYACFAVLDDGPRYCVDFTEELSSKLNGSGGSAPSTKGAAGFAVKAIYDYTAADKDEVSSRFFEIYFSGLNAFDV